MNKLHLDQNSIFIAKRKQYDLTKMTLTEVGSEFYF